MSSRSDVVMFPAVDWVKYKQRHCQQVDFCGFDYPLDRKIGTEPPPAAEVWAKLILTSVSFWQGDVEAMTRID